MMFASLELNWIRRKCGKDLPLPAIVLVDNHNFAGRYCIPLQNQESMEFYHGISCPMKNGVIQLSTSYGDNNIDSTIAHEWRHHWQYFNGWTLRIASFTNWSAKYDYETAVRKYVESDAAELDAVRFEHKHSRLSESDLKINYDLLVGIRSRACYSFAPKIHA